jgi:hypothetical protein
MEACNPAPGPYRPFCRSALQEAQHGNTKSLRHLTCTAPVSRELTPMPQCSLLQDTLVQDAAHVLDVED